MPGRALWMTTPLRTIAEQVYDYERHARTSVRKYGSVQAGRHPIGVRRDDGAPYSNRLDTLSYRFVDCAPVEGRKSLIRGETPRISGAEGLFEAPPEVCQPHGKSLPAAPRRPCSTAR